MGGTSADAIKSTPGQKGINRLDACPRLRGGRLTNRPTCYRSLESTVEFLPHSPHVKRLLNTISLVGQRSHSHTRNSQTSGNYYFNQIHALTPSDLDLLFPIQYSAECKFCQQPGTLRQIFGECELNQEFSPPAVPLNSSTSKSSGRHSSALPFQLTLVERATVVKTAYGFL